MFDKNFALTDKVAVVTGGASGIGRAIVELFFEKGARVVLVDIKPDVAEIAQQIGGARALGIQADITKKEIVEGVMATVVEQFGSIDIVVNSAGIALLEKAADLPESYWDKTMELNLKASFLIAQAAGNVMIKQGRGGKIVNMASQASVVALDKHVAYCASRPRLFR